MNIGHLSCPDCAVVGELRPSDASVDTRIKCSACGSEYPVREGAPVLIQASNALFDRSYYERATSGGIYRQRRFRLPSPSVNLARVRVLERLGRVLADRPAEVLILGSGRQRELIRSMLGNRPNIRLICCDVDVTADVDLFCDAHNLPFANGYFDALVTTAVLEHVLYPEMVAGEIARVVRVGGWIYSELPFLQQVHEGAYDFTRYTMSGHRRLLNAFKEVESGVLAGPATALVWSIEHFAAALFGMGLLGKLARGGARLMFFWLKYLDYLIAHRRAAIDSASCTYFFGQRKEGRVSDREIVRAYDGAREVSHT